MSVHADCAKYLYQTQGVSGTAPNLVLNIYHGFFSACIYIYIYMHLYVSPSREIHVQFEIYWYLLLFDMYLPASTHLIFFI